MIPENLDAYSGAYGESFPFADENFGILETFAGYFLDSIASFEQVDLLSLGIGYRNVSRRIVRELGPRLSSYTILEGSRTVIRQFELDWPLAFRPNVIATYFENYQTTQRFDAVEMGFVLEHVDDPALILQLFGALLKPEGVIGMAVPNARSLHRLIGSEAGLLDDVYRLSEFDLALGHKRYFDLASFHKLAVDAGLVVRRSRGIMMKPVTTAQLAALKLPDAVVQALYKVADPLPDIANAIYLEASRP